MHDAQDNDDTVLMSSPHIPAAQDKGNAVLITSLRTPASQPSSLTDDPEIRRTRKILLILLRTILVLAVLATIGSIAGNVVTNNSEYSSRGVEISRSLIPVVFLTFGYLVAHRYSKIGLLVSSWLNIIELVINAIIIVLLFVACLTSLTNASSVNNSQTNGMLVGASIVFFVLIVIIIAALILHIVIGKFAFKLARLIEAKKSSFCQQI
ncbi:unnamed protein product [Rotaria socialis]|uniref:Uncharacterized protein n=1 Tax=Rotaria socialis TaxID=392032 RepID=A0A821QS45_9BILA|nr:unnamed protein product [Rotaria socialis]CAF4831127.1 unnamed protein product [Rotaria socialis]